LYSKLWVDMPQLALPQGISCLVFWGSGWHQSLRVQ
jgi:hypothetical protein